MTFTDSQNKFSITENIKQFALNELQLSLIGVSKPDRVEDFLFYKSWIEDGFAGEMSYLKKYLDKKEFPEQLFPNTKSIICVAQNYYTETVQENFKVAKYALGDDYHLVLKKKLSHLLEYIQTLDEQALGKVCVDTAPVLERSLAKRSGLGWTGKNTMLINPKKGSYFFLGEIFLDIELDYDKPFSKNHCGNCTRCIDACPTDAIIQEGKIDSNKCISYWTIESKENIPNSIYPNLEKYIFGCDICQDVCPWNKKFLTETEEESYYPRNWLKDKNIKDLLVMEQSEFSKIFKNSAIKRSKLKGFMRNIISMISSTENKNDYLNLLQRMSESDELIIQNQAQETINFLEGK